MTAKTHTCYAVFDPDGKPKWYTLRDARAWAIGCHEAASGMLWETSESRGYTVRKLKLTEADGEAGTETLQGGEESTSDPAPPTTTGQVRCPDWEECDDSCGHWPPHGHNTTRLRDCDGVTRTCPACVPAEEPGEEIDADFGLGDKPSPCEQRAAEPEDPPALSPYERFAARAKAAGLTARDHGEFWSIRGGMKIVYVWRSRSARGWCRPLGGEAKEATLAEAIAMAKGTT